MEVDLIIEGPGLVLFPIEIKFTQTPKMSMARQIHRFKKTFPKLNIHEGRLLSLTDTPVQFQRSECTAPFELFKLVEYPLKIIPPCIFSLFRNTVLIHHQK